MSEKSIAIVGAPSTLSEVVFALSRRSVGVSLEQEQLVHTRHINDFDRLPMIAGMGDPPDPSKDTSTITLTFRSNTYSTGDSWAGYAATSNWYGGWDYLAEQAAIEKAWKRRWQDFHSLKTKPYFYSIKSAPKTPTNHTFLRVPGLIQRRKSPFSPSMKAHASFMKGFRRSLLSRQ